MANPTLRTEARNGRKKAGERTQSISVKEKIMIISILFRDSSAAKIAAVILGRTCITMRMAHPTYTGFAMIMAKKRRIHHVLFRCTSGN